MKMRLIVCLDDKNGMAFNHRRQSRDRIITETIEELVKGSTLHFSPYSAKLFPSGVFEPSEDYLSRAGEDDFCFVELEDVTPYERQIEEITVFRWNRVYPADLTFPIDLTQWSLERTVEFPGHSHEKITMEVYRR
ncbi:ribonuclease Z [Pseudoflavonifractor capillosus]|uniref:ribonuclease Z n=1 Tax=Pseudoflavonifractor capillosus TaxID=106588 RepID=UPI001FB01A78|nr:ribonuclease Z [Pseudoflavonifractor capillosus]